MSSIPRLNVSNYFNAAFTNGWHLNKSMPLVWRYFDSGPVILKILEKIFAVQFY